MPRGKKLTDEEREAKRLKANEWQKEYERKKREKYLAEHPELAKPRDSIGRKNGATASTDVTFEEEQPENRHLPEIDFGELNPKQKLFCQARSRYIAYGGARGGGKTHVLRIKAVGGAMHISNLRILIVRREYPELEQSIIIPIRKMVPADLATYNGSMRMMTFWNGSIIKFGHYGANDDIEYQGQEWDWIFIDEATQFTESQFRTLGACLRGATKIPRRMYLTCNPGGIGHAWVKRLFIDREYNEGENKADYTFIAATVDDNPQLLEASPEYKQMLDLLPEDVRRAWRYGDWNALAGTFFNEFHTDTHVIEPFVRIPAEWKKYRAFDYGLDMFACLWVAVDFEGRCYVYREVQQSGLIVSEAARMALECTPPNEYIEFTIAPPDMWNRQKDSGKSMAEIFAQNGVGLLRASNNRIQGWMAVKEMLKPMKNDTDKPGLLVTNECRGLIRNIQLIQHDEKNPSDCATQPHDISHICDALRYFAVTRTLHAERAAEPATDDWYEEATDYDDEMTGGDFDDSYMTYGG